MIFGRFAGDGELMPSRFIEVSLKIYTTEYLKLLEVVLLPWIRKPFDASRVMQDSAPDHSSKKKMPQSFEEGIVHVCPLSYLALKLIRFEAF